MTEPTYICSQCSGETELDGFAVLDLPDDSVECFPVGAMMAICFNCAENKDLVTKFVSLPNGACPSRDGVKQGRIEVGAKLKYE